MRRAKTLAFLLPVLAVLAAAVPDGGAADRAALLQFKSSVSDPAGLLAAWSDSPGSDFCRWPGVTCDAASSRVVSLNISAAGPASSRLGGKLTPALSALTELAALALPSHALAGPIPPEIWRLGSLRALDLSSNELSGPLPASGFALISLRSLNLSHNLLSGEIPASLSACVNLEALDLSGNRLTGALPSSLLALPSSLLALPNLKVLSLASNRLSGPLPPELGSRCPSLEHLDLSRNLLVDAIPPGLGNCTQLQSLKLFSNLFNDAIPPELGRLKKLHALDVSRNSLSGFLPPELGGCGELSVLVLSNPYDPVPAGADLRYVDSDDFNYFQGEIPESVTRLPKLRIVWAPRASLEGDIPGHWGGCQSGSLEMVNLGGNLLSGEVPKVFSQCWSLKFLNLSSNRLMGQLARDLPVPCMDVFDISGNQLSGTIPRFSAVSCVASRFPFDDLSSAYSSFFAYRTQMGISLPCFDSKDVYVVYHHFGVNNFTGPLPSLPILTKRLGEGTVYAFLAGGNKLGGQLTDALFDKCKGLNGLVISLSNNLISGGIQPSIGDMCDALMVFDVAGNMITGMIPESFGHLGNLIGLDLSMNGLSGQIPASFEKLKGLKYLSLARNKLSGPLPAGLNQLLSLVLLDLSSNFLTGGIPNGLAELRNLSTLLLDNNRLCGQIPPSLANMSSLSMFNVSFNNLSGPLPSNARILKCASLVGNPLLHQSCPVDTVSLPPSIQGRNRDYEAYTYPPPGGSTNGSGSSGFNSIEIASIASAAAIVSVLLALIVLYIYTRKCAPRSQVQSSGRRDVTIFTDIGVPITYESVVRATGNFNASNCIGSGGFGATYKAEISPGVVVAIKRLSIGRFQGVQQFDAEIKTLGRWRHPNLVTLIGYHVSESEMFLIYNYLPGGNLERFIQERHRRPVDWKMLHKIALDVARALAYLHDHCVPRILHRDVKPSNILLDNDFNAYLSDFGLARLLGNSETHATTGVAGTFGYVAPEYAMTCRVSDKADVYSYGVVLLELISDKKALDPSFSPYGNGFNIVAWACMLLQQGKAKEFFTEGLWDVGPHDVLVETLHLALMCTVETLSIRPTMKQVVQRLKQLQPPTC